MSDFSEPPRHRFVATAGVASEAILFIGCGGRSSSPASLSPCTEAMMLTPATNPEIITPKLGYFAIAESAALTMARGKSCCDHDGLTGVDLSKPASWGAGGDNLIAEEVRVSGSRNAPMMLLA